MLPLRRLEIRRHATQGTDLGGDCLSAEGVELAYQVGRSIRVGYTHLYSSGAQRDTQTLACMLAGMGGHRLSGVVVRPGLGSSREEEWKAAAAGSTKLDALLQANEALVGVEAERLAGELRSLIAELPEGGYALAIGRSPMIECGIWGLTGKRFDPLGECEGFLIAEHRQGRLEVEEVRRGMHL